MDGPFFGRGADLRRLRELVAAQPIATVFGLGGVGKTRLAREWAGALNAPVYFCDLTHVSSTGEIERALAHTLGLSLSEADADTWQWALEAKSDFTLIVDNADRHTDGLATCLQRFGGRGKLVVTARAKLGMKDEAAFELGPLDVDAARALFLDRAARVVPGLALDEGEIAVLDSLLEQLDFLPLPIELAAARIGAFSVGELGERLRHNLSLLKNNREPASRQASIERVLDGTWQTLSAAEQRTASQLSVISGQFARETAEAVVDAGGEPVADLVERLQAMAIVRVSGRDAERGPRFSMYETIRVYAGQRLLDSERDEVILRLQKHLLQRLMANFKKPRSFDAVAAIEEEFDNLMLASRHGEPAMRRAIVLLLDPVLLARGPLDLHLELVEGALQGWQDEAPSEMVSGLLAARAENLSFRGELERALDDLRLAERLGFSHWMAKIHALSGRAYNSIGRFEEARAAFERSLACARAVNDGFRVADVLSDLGLLRDDRAMVEEAIGVARRIGIWHVEVRALCVMGILLGDLGRKEALGYLQEANDICRAQHNDRAIGITLVLIGIAHVMLDAPVAARPILLEAAERTRRTGSRFYYGSAGAYLGFAALLSGEAAFEVVRVRKIAGELATLTNPWSSALLNSVLALLLNACGQSGEAEAAFEAARRRGQEVSFAGHALSLDATAAMLQLARSERAPAETTVAAISEYLAISIDAPARDRKSEVIIFQRILSRALGKPQPPRIDVGNGCEWICISGSPRLDLSRKHTLRRIIEVLVEAHLRSPNEIITAPALFQRVWPGVENFEALYNRLHNAMATLRQLGLKDVITTVNDGYAFAPDCIIERR